MKRIFIVFLFLFLFLTVVFPQKGLEWIPACERSILDSLMNLSYTYNENYIPDSISLSNYELNANQRVNITSKDGHFMVMFDISPPFTQEDSIRYAKNDNYILDRNLGHMSFVKSIVDKHYGKQHVENWQDYVFYLSDVEAKTKFNADTAFYMSLPEKKYYSRYNYCKVLVIQKYNRGSLPMFFLYDDEGKENLEKHIAAMENSFRYGDDLPLKEKLDSECIVRVIASPKQKKNAIIR